MEKIQEIENRMFTLKKRFRQPEMKEIFESSNKSIIEVYERMCKTKTSNNTREETNKKNEVKKITPTLKVIKDTNPVTKPSFVTITDKELSSDKCLDKDDINQAKPYSSAKGKNLNGSIGSTKLHTLIDKGKIQGEVSQFKDNTNSSSSEKNQEKIRDNIPKSRSHDRRTQKSQNKIQPLPANNLLNIDEWQNSEKFPVVKNSNLGFHNSKLNTIKNDLISGNVNHGNDTNLLATNNNNSLNIPADFIGINQNVSALPLAKNLLLKNLNERKLEIEIKNENLEEKNSIISNPENKNITVDDSFYDQKEDLFVNNLPPEVMGGTPEFEKDEEMQVNKNEENQGFNNISKQVVPLPPKPRIEEKIENNLNNKEVKSLNNVISTKITIPNTFNNETILSNNSKPNNHQKKNLKIIDDDEEEEVVTNQNPLKIISMFTENPIESASHSNSNYTSSKIKIPLDFKDFKSPLISESAKSAKSSKSFENVETSNYYNTHNTHIVQNLNSTQSNIASPQDKIRDAENNYNTIIIDKKNLKNFKKSDALEIGNYSNNPNIGLANLGNSVNNTNIEPAFKKNQSLALVSSNDSQGNKINFEKKLAELIDIKKIKIDESKTKLKQNNPQNVTGNVANNQPTIYKSSTNPSINKERSHQTQLGHSSLNTERKQETCVQNSSTIVSHKEITTNLSNTISSTYKSSSNVQTGINNHNIYNTGPHTQLHGNPTTKNMNSIKNEINHIDPILNYNEKIERKNHIACFIISVNEIVTKLKEKVVESISKNQSLLITTQNEYDSIKSSILDAMIEDNSNKGVKILSDKFSKLVIRLLEFLNADELLEKFYLETQLTNSLKKFLLVHNLKKTE